MDIESVLSGAPADAVFYVCGSARLIDAVIVAARALNIDSHRIRIERFTASIDADAKPIELELRRSGRRLLVDRDRSVLDAMLDAGVDAPFSCRTGTCKTCAVKVLDGDVVHRDSVLSDDEREHGQMMCPCVSRTSSDHLVLDF